MLMLKNGRSKGNFCSIIVFRIIGELKLLVTWKLAPNNFSPSKIVPLCI